jgi:hypothetical protein
VVWASIWKRCHELLFTAARRVEGHITAVAYYCTIVVPTFVIPFDNMRELNKGTTGIQSGGSSSGVETLVQVKLKLAILREITAGQCLSAGRSSALVKRRSLRVTPACRISVSHQLAIVSVLRQLAGFQCHSSWQVAGLAVQKLAILREMTAGQCLSAGRSSASVKRRNLRVTPAC